MSKSSIEWTEQTWNPIVGCGVVSPGCTNCYAMKMAARIEAINEGLPAAHRHGGEYIGTTRKVNGNAVWTGKVAMAGERKLLAPLRRKKPTTYFVNSMGDLFHEDIPDEWIDKVFAVMALCPQHMFQVLTKRSARMRAYLTAARASRVGMEAFEIVLNAHAKNRRSMVGAGIILTGDIPHLKVWPLPNVWLGVSTEDQRRADERIPDLLNTPAAVRFISAEPLLAPVDIAKYLRPGCDRCAPWETPCQTGCSNVTRIDWVITGGESGPDARPMHPDWARALRDQCSDSRVPFFFKQWGAWETRYDRDQHDPDWRRCNEVAQWPNSQWLNLAGGQGFHGERVLRVSRVGKTKTGRLLDGIEHNGMPGVRP